MSAGTPPRWGRRADPLNGVDPNQEEAEDALKASEQFAAYDRSFWAHVKLVSEKIGYSERRTGRLRRYTVEQLVACLQAENLAADHLSSVDPSNSAEFGQTLQGYLNFRATVLEDAVRPNLMNREEAQQIFTQLQIELNPTCHLPMNKQRGDKRHHAYLVGIVNMLTQRALGSRSFDDNPRGLTILTREHRPLRTLSRWMDGAYPGRLDPYAVWEIKEYYGTTTFGSRVADGIYETMLDGEEIKEVDVTEGRRILHYLIVDDRFTWWDCGRSYLCRIIDMLHMGLIDEALFGREVITRWPEIVRSWP